MDQSVTIEPLLRIVEHEKMKFCCVFPCGGHFRLRSHVQSYAKISTRGRSSRYHNQIVSWSRPWRSGLFGYCAAVEKYLAGSANFSDELTSLDYMNFKIERGLQARYYMPIDIQQRTSASRRSLLWKDKESLVLQITGEFLATTEPWRNHSV